MIRKSFRAVLLGIALVLALGWLLQRSRHPRMTATRGSPTGPSSVQPAPPIPLTPATGALSGAVRSVDGRVVAGAQVCAASVAAQVLGGIESRCVETGRDGGRYLVADLPAGVYVVTATARGYLPGASGGGQTVLVPASQEIKNVDFELEPGGARLDGIVVDATGGPIHLAHVAISFGWPAVRTVSVDTNPDGHFVAWLAPGWVALTAHATGYAPATASHVAPSSDLVIRMTPGSSIRGTVVAADGGKPVPDVTVRAVPEHGALTAASPSGISASDGTYAIVGLDPGQYTLLAEGEGWQGRGPGQGRVPVGIAQTIDRVVVTVSRAAHVTGTVSLLGGDPCTRGTVSLGPPGFMDSSFDPPSASTWASAPFPSRDRVPLVPTLISSIDEMGAVLFRAVPSGTYHAVVQCSDHVLMDGPTTVEVGQANVDGLAWHVAPGLAMVVHLVDEANQPLADTRFRFTWPDRGSDRPPTNMEPTTDSRGTYQTESTLYPGTYLLRPTTGYEGAPLSVDLRDGQGKIDVVYRLEGSGSIEVTVRSPDGVTIDDVRVTSKSKDPSANGSAAAVGNPLASMPRALPPGWGALEAVALGNGRFRLGPLAKGTYEVTVDDAVNSPVTRTVQVASGVIKQGFTLDRSSSIRGKVVDSVGQAVPDVWVSAECVSGDSARSPSNDIDPMSTMSRGQKRVVTDATGAFVLGGLARAATCKVRAQEPGGTLGVDDGVHPGDEIAVSMRPLGSLSGSAQTTDGQAVERFTISIQNLDVQQTRSETVTSSGGNWTLPGVVPGKLRLFAHDNSGEFALMETDLAPGQSLSGVELAFAPRPARGLPGAATR